MVEQKKKKVLLVVSTLNTGGAQRAFANMSMGFPKDWECDFLLNDSADISYPYQGNIIDLGMKPRKDKTALSYQAQVFLKRYLMLRKLKRSGEYVACISALTSANAVNVLTGDRYCKTVISIRIFMSKAIEKSSGIQKQIKRWVMKTLSNRADYVVSVSGSMRLDLVSRFGVEKEKAVTIYNGYHLNRINESAQENLSKQEEQWFAGGKQIIVTVGRLDAQKGQNLLIHAFRMVKEVVPDMRLLLLGDGPLKEEIRRLIKRLGLEKDVILCGFVKNPYKIIKRCDLFVLPSLYEGFPNTLAESLCLGVPVISADCDSGPREILAPETEVMQKVESGFEKAQYGLLCPVSDSQALSEAILYLLQNNEEYQHYKKMCDERAEQLSMEKMIEKWIALIEA